MDQPHASLMAHVMNDVMVLAPLANEGINPAPLHPQRPRSPSSRSTALVDVFCPFQLKPSVLEPYRWLDTSKY